MGDAPIERVCVAVVVTVAVADMEDVADDDCVPLRELLWEGVPERDDPTLTVWVCDAELLLDGVKVDDCVLL